MKQTNWTKATLSKEIAIKNFLDASAHYKGKKVWIELQENGQQAHPILIKNPALKDIRNWDMLYASPGRVEYSELERMSEVEKDLTLNYTQAYGEREAIDKYYDTGEISESLVKGMGICFAIKKSDFLKARPDLEGWTEDKLWTTRWQPRHGIPYWTPEKLDQMVYVICVDEEQPADDKVDEIIKAISQG